MSGVELPIERVPNTSPPRFRWRQHVEALGGARMVEHEGTVPPTLESALIQLIVLAKQQARDIDNLQRMAEELTKQVALQKMAEELPKQVALQTELLDIAALPAAEPPQPIDRESTRHESEPANPPTRRRR